ncbi:GOLPH3/VPS74 family protein [Georgenia sp. Z1491]|uniref:GOLPH3/VPS74 family protein n=1 Tax=Georgenia sp. Z1491 TaxID=3416707 RepID=UPI003CEBCDBA
MSSTTTSAELVVEDLLLVLFDERHHLFRGEGQRLFHALAGALLVDLAEQGLVTPDADDPRDAVRAASEIPPGDELLRIGWDVVARRPVTAQSFVLQVGPRLRAPVIDRLVDRGHLGSERRKILGFVPSTRLTAGESTRREQLVETIRGVLVDGDQAGTHDSAVAAILFAAGAAPLMHPEIPWSGAVHAHGTELVSASRAATGTAEVVHQMIATLVSTSVFVSLAAGSRD